MKKQTKIDIKQQDWTGTTTEDRGPYIQTYLGNKFYLFDPRPEDIHIEDIAHALSNVCRFAGHVSSFYSVSQHSVLVSQNCNIPLYGLLHDAAEAYVHDITRPLKYAKGMEVYSKIEKQIIEIIAQRFNLPLNFSHYPDIKQADILVLITEARDLMGDPSWTKEFPFPPLKQKIVPLSPKQAKKLFWNRWKELS